MKDRDVYLVVDFLAVLVLVLALSGILGGLAYFAWKDSVAALMVLGVGIISASIWWVEKRS